MGRLGFFGVIVCLVIFSTIMVWFEYRQFDQPETLLQLVQQEHIIDEGQYIIKPIIEKQRNDYFLSFIINLKSFQNRSLLSINYLENSILEVDGKFDLYPFNWQILESDQYTLIGKLKFDISLNKDMSSIVLKLFTFTDNEINWVIK